MSSINNEDDNYNEYYCIPHIHAESCHMIDVTNYVLSGDFDTADTLIRSGIKLFDGYDKYTSLHVACIIGELEFVEYCLIDFDINVVSYNGLTPMDIMIKHGMPNRDIFNMFRERGGMITNESLVLAVTSNSVELVKIVLDMLPCSVYYCEDDGIRHIIECAESIEMLRLLLDKKALIPESELFNACNANNSDKVSTLLEYGAEIDERSIKNLLRCCKMKIEILKLLASNDKHFKILMDSSSLLPHIKDKLSQFISNRFSRTKSARSTRSPIE